MVVCLYDVSMMRIGVEGAHQEEEEPSHHHVARGMSLPHEPSQRKPRGYYCFAPHLTGITFADVLPSGLSVELFHCFLEDLLVRQNPWRLCPSLRCFLLTSRLILFPNRLVLHRLRGPFVADLKHGVFARVRRGEELHWFSDGLVWTSNLKWRLVPPYLVVYLVSKLSWES
jgi:hypothetical protein